MRPRRSAIPFLVILATVAFIGSVLAVSAPQARRPTHEAGSRGKNNARTEATRLVTGDPAQINAVVAGTPPTAIVKIVPGTAKIGSYPPGTTIVGNELKASAGGFRAWFDFKLKDWDPNGDDLPPFGLWQFGIDSSGYMDSDAPGDQPDLAPPVIACPNNATCIAAFGEAWAKCSASTCSAIYVDRAGAKGADSWCADTGSGPCDLADCDVATLNYRCFAIYPTGVPRPDGGIEYYGGTLVLDIPAGTKGKYTVNLDASQTFLLDTGVPSNDIPTLAETGFVVNIETGKCCSGLGTPGESCTDDLTQAECDATDAPNAFTPGGLCADGCVECLTNADCNDNDACTTDVCIQPAGVCTRVNVPSWDTVTECCDPATGAQAAKDDGNACTDDACSLDPTTGTPKPGNGVATHTPSSSSTACDDGNPCTTADYCVGPPSTACAGTDINSIPCVTNADCPLDPTATPYPCVSGFCVCAASPCETLPDESVCTDNDVCTTGDLCSSGFCIGDYVPNCCHTDAECNDFNDCTTESCMGNVCTYVSAAMGTPCGSSLDDDCTDPDSCDASGNCLPNNAANGSICVLPDGTFTCRSGLCAPQTYRAVELPKGGGVVESRAKGGCKTNDGFSYIILQGLKKASDLTKEIAAVAECGADGDNCVTTELDKGSALSSKAKDVACSPLGKCMIVGTTDHLPAAWVKDGNGSWTLESPPLPLGKLEGELWSVSWINGQFMAAGSARQQISPANQTSGMTEGGVAVTNLNSSRSNIYRRAEPNGPWTGKDLPDYGVANRESKGSFVAVCPAGAAGPLCYASERVIAGWAENGKGKAELITWTENGVDTDVFVMSEWPLPSGIKGVKKGNKDKDEARISVFVTGDAYNGTGNVVGPFLNGSNLNFSRSNVNSATADAPSGDYAFPLPALPGKDNSFSSMRAAPPRNNNQEKRVGKSYNNDEDPEMDGEATEWTIDYSGPTPKVIAKEKMNDITDGLDGATLQDAIDIAVCDPGSPAITAGTKVGNIGSSGEDGVVMLFSVPQPPQIIGACCDDATSICTDDVAGAACLAPALRHGGDGSTCAGGLTPFCGFPAGARGPCCDDASGTCSEDINPNVCTSAGPTFQYGGDGLTCAGMIPACVGSCTTNADCNDLLTCTVDSCVAGVCVNTYANGISQSPGCGPILVRAGTSLTPFVLSNTASAPTTPPTMIEAFLDACIDVKLYAMDTSASQRGVSCVFVDVLLGDTPCPLTANSASPAEFDQFFHYFNEPPDRVLDVGGCTTSGGVGVGAWAQIGTIQVQAPQIACGPSPISVSASTFTQSSLFGQGFADVDMDPNNPGLSVQIKCWGSLFDHWTPGGGDGFVDAGDFSLFAPCWLSSSPVCKEFDYDLDGVVGPGDFSYFATAWQRGVCAGGIALPGLQLGCGSTSSFRLSDDGVITEVEMLWATQEEVESFGLPYPHTDWEGWKLIPPKIEEATPARLSRELSDLIKKRRR